MVRNVAEVVCGRDVACLGSDAGQGVERKDFDVGIVVATRLVEGHRQSVAGAWVPLRSVEGGQQAFTEQGLFSAVGSAMPLNGRFELRSRPRDLINRTQDAPEMNTRERRQTYIAGRLGLHDRKS